MANSYNTIEDRIIKVLESIPDGNDPNIAALARDNNLPVHRLRARWNGRLSRENIDGHNKTLLNVQETALCQFLDRMKETDIYARYRIITACANFILERGHTDLSTHPPLKAKEKGKACRITSENTLRQHVFLLEQVVFSDKNLALVLQNMGESDIQWRKGVKRRSTWSEPDQGESAGSWSVLAIC